jgi:hypothetical protein
VPGHATGLLLDTLWLVEVFEVELFSLSFHIVLIDHFRGTWSIFAIIFFLLFLKIFKLGVVLVNFIESFPCEVALVNFLDVSCGTV